MTTDRHHNLDDVRQIPSHDPTCARCAKPLALVALEAIYTPRRGGPTFCSKDCWGDYAWAHIGTKGYADRFAHGDSTPPSEAYTKATAPRPKPSEPRLTIAEINARHAERSAAAQAGIAAANVVGFILWLIVVSVIGTVIWAII